jgi:hypothetical protein
VKSRGAKKSLGIALGENSALVAELIGGEKPSLSHAAQFAYPAGITLAAPESLGKALAVFLRENQFTARVAAVGLSTRQLATRSKVVPPVDAKTLASMLRLQTEADFSGDLKSLLFDYLPPPSPVENGAGAKDPAATTPADADSFGGSQSVLLVATQASHVEAASSLCEAAGLTLSSVGASAISLAMASASGGATESIALHVLPVGVEMALIHGGTVRLCRYAPHTTAAMIVGDIRRSLHGIPGAAPREISVWGETLADLPAMEAALSARVRRGEIRSLGIAPSSDPAIGDGSRFAAAAALALTALAGEAPTDFADSHLAPTPAQRIPRWAIAAAVAALIFIGGIIYAYEDYQHNAAQIDNLQAQLNDMGDDVKAATEFVSRVQFAQHWHLGQARYLSCLRDLTNAVPEDGQTYAVRISLHEVDPTASITPGADQTPAEIAKAAMPAYLTGTLSGKTANQQSFLMLPDRMANIPSFSNVSPGGTNNELHSHESEVTFSVDFDYRLPTPPTNTPANTSTGATPATADRSQLDVSGGSAVADANRSAP